MAVDTTPQLDYLSPPESFSRVQSTKNELEALCRKLQLQSQSRVFQLRKLSLTPGRHQQEVQDIINDLKEGMKDFAGTAQELKLARDLLLLLKSQGDFPAWVDLYLQAAYQHPTDPLVGGVAEEALTLSRDVGRQDEVLAALNHVAMIPIDFEAKAKIITALNHITKPEVVKTSKSTAPAARTGS